jgi:hypothetical protein
MKVTKRFRYPKAEVRVQGEPCINGCGDIRYRRNGTCVVCRSTRTTAPNRLDENTENRRLMRLYGITLAERAKLAESQQFRCAICRTRETPTTHRLCVDHDKAQRRVRGLLCYNCNRALGGYFGDDIEMLERAIAYLKGKGG